MLSSRCRRGTGRSRTGGSKSLAGLGRSVCPKRCLGRTGLLSFALHLALRHELAPPGPHRRCLALTLRSSDILLQQPPRFAIGRAGTDRTHFRIGPVDRLHRHWNVMPAEITFCQGRARARECASARNGRVRDGADGADGPRQWQCVRSERSGDRLRVSVTAIKWLIPAISLSDW